VINGLFWKKDMTSIYKNDVLGFDPVTVSLLLSIWRSITQSVNQSCNKKRSEPLNLNRDHFLNPTFERFRNHLAEWQHSNGISSIAQNL